MRFLAIFTIAIIVLMPFISSNVFQYSEAKKDTDKGKYVILEGYLNTLVIDYINGTESHEHILFVKDDKSGKHVTYELKSKGKDLSDLSGREVKVKGNLKEEKQKDKSSPAGTIQSIEVETIEATEEGQSASQSQESTGEPGLPYTVTPVPSPLKTVAALLQYPDLPISYNNTYFEDIFFDQDNSLAAYYNNHSYGALTIEGQVVDWQLLSTNAASCGPNGCDPWITIGNALDLMDPLIDFDGPDNVIQNYSPYNLRVAGNNGDDIDNLVLVYNGGIGCLCAKAYLDPVVIPTDEGIVYVGLSFIPNLNGNWAYGSNTMEGYGVTAHEMGHTFGWAHTDYNTWHWSVMAPISGDNDPLPGIPSIFKYVAGWIPWDKIITVMPGEETFTLDLQSMPEMGNNSLMAVVPYKNNSGLFYNFYVLEARMNSQYDQILPNGLLLTIFTSPAVQYWATFQTALPLGFTFHGSNNVDVSYTSNSDNSITVNVVSNADLGIPVTSPDSAFTTMNTPVVIPVLENDYDPEGKPLSVAFVFQGQNGVATKNADNTITYTPNSGFYGTDSFLYSPSDGVNVADGETVTVTVSELVAHWKFENDASDSSGNNDGTIVGNPTFINGMIGNAIDLDGIDDYVTVPLTPSLDVTTSSAFTASAWIKPSSVANRAGIINYHNIWPFICEMRAGGHITLMITPESGAGATEITSSITVPANTWSHVACTYDGTVGKVYINGVERGSASHSGGMKTPIAGVYLGSYNGNEQYFDGAIDDARIYKRALTSAEILEQATLMAHWKFDNSLLDASIYHNDGTSYGNLAFGTGKIGNAIILDGNDDYMMASLTQSLDVTTSNAFTASAWIKPSSIANRYAIVDYHNIWPFICEMRAGGYVALMITPESGGGATEIISSTTVSPNIWSHIACTFDGATGRIYVDGVERGSASHSGGMKAPIAGVYLGTYNAGVDQDFTGAIDDARIYKRALTAQEILELAQS